MRFAPGQRVRVSDRPHVGHHRTPQYVKGKTGRVERVHGAFANPEKRAYGADGLPQVPLYLVAFAQRDLWPDYTRTDELHVDVYEHWLEGA